MPRKSLRETAAQVFTLLAVTGCISFLGHSPELMILGATAAGILGGRAWILRERAENPERPVLAAPVSSHGLIAHCHSADAELADLCDRIQKAAASRDMGPLMLEQLAQIDQLVETHHRMGLELANYRVHLAEHPISVVTAELGRVEAKLAEATDATRPLLEQNREILKMRLDKLQAIQSSRDLATAQRGVIEDTLKLIHDQVLAANSPEDLRGALTRVTAGVRSTDEALAETRALLGSQQRLRELT